ncbi:BBA14 family lipoprotein [Borreliella bavariensis]|uniref:BBA14 family lipoprotein n=3 Tax=Borreliella bavariensis TaxID=664662 RepID=UPI001BFFF996|nr:BBA14 family lipoprotein [Borreliella bavariensis]
MQKFKTKISFIGIFWVLLLLLSCESIPSLPKNPTLTNKEDISSLISDEAELFRYATSLNVWLLSVKAYANKYYAGEKFPIFENFNPEVDDENEPDDTNMLKNRIAYYRRYIEKTEPIVFDCYKKYSRR